MDDTTPSAPSAPSGSSSPILFVAAHGLFAVAGAVGFFVGVTEASPLEGAVAPAWAVPLAIVGGVAAVVSLALLPLALAVQGLAGAVGAPRGNDRGSEILRDQTRLLQQIHEHTMLSDRSKRLIYRPKELQLLRSAIEDDIAQADYDAAVTLCNEMAEDFGFREEAEEYRARIETARREERDTQVSEAILHLDEALEHREWPRARNEAARIRRLFPDAEIVETLDRRIDDARAQHKHELEQRFLAAADHGDVENAMLLLRQLDHYLNPDEAARLREVAHGVVSRHRENLGVQFKLAVNDHRWTEAVRVGEEIIAEFPNTKMAGEVRSMLDVLRTRASQAAVAASQV